MEYLYGAGYLIGIPYRAHYVSRFPGPLEALLLHIEYASIPSEYGLGQCTHPGQEVGGREAGGQDLPMIEGPIYLAYPGAAKEGIRHNR